MFLRRYIEDIFSIQSTVVLLSLSLFSMLLTLIRIIVTNSSHFLFLWGNLFLAIIPWVIATLISVRQIHNKWILAILLIFWVILFPNAPYILTDLVHLHGNHGVPLWFDMILILSFGFTGMLYGFVSLYLLELRLLIVLPRIWSIVVPIVLIHTACFGIYLGRFLRWHSWNLVNKTGQVLSDILDRIANPLTHHETWEFTLLFGTFLSLAYWSFKAFSRDSSYRLKKTVPVRKQAS